ncbi:MAG: LPS assembly lipoprotein LptE [Halioglobus sp.]|nr:LPS assembly lipoprotein LptE [Halioglobus sp.]
MQTTTGHRQRGLALLLVATTILLGGCGFQLRGVGNSATLLPEEWKQMHLVTNNPNSEFSREVSARFELNGVTWAERADANYVLLLGPEDFQQRNLSLNSEARAAEFELTMRASFTVQTADGRVAMRQTTSSVVKQMENDPRNVVGKSEEIRLLQQEMRAELAQRILRSIGFYAASARAESADPG